MRPALAFLFLTATAAAQWQLQQSNTTADLRGIHSLGNGIAWASGSKGTILRTTDNGTIWQPCTIPLGAEALDFRGIQAFDAKTAIIMSSGKGDLSRLYKTTDACKTWTLLFTNPDPEGFWDAISLQELRPGHLNGWLLGDPVNHEFTVYSIYDDSPDAGQPSGFRASREDTPSLAANGDVTGAFAASNSSLSQFTSNHRTEVFFVTGGLAGARVYRRLPLVAGDVTFPLYWDSRPVPLGSMTTPSGAFSISVTSDTVGVAVGGDYSKPDSDKGTAAYLEIGFNEFWTPARTAPHGYRSAVAPVSGRNGSWITVGPNGTDASTDDGRNWHPLRPTPGEPADADQHWNALSLPFVVGPHGRIGLLLDSALKAKP